MNHAAILDAIERQLLSVPGPFVSILSTDAMKLTAVIRASLILREFADGEGRAKLIAEFDDAFRALEQA